MAREKKAVERGRITMPRYGINLPLMLGANNQFYAVYGDHRIEDPVADVVIATMQRYIEANWSIVWLPTILITELSPSSGQVAVEDAFYQRAAFVGIRIQRFYLARKADGELLQVDWDCEEADRMVRSRSFWWPVRHEKAPDPIPFPFHGEGSWGAKHHYYAYESALWVRLTLLRSEIARIHALTQEIVTTEQGMARLLDRDMTRLLDAPKEDA